MYNLQSSKFGVLTELNHNELGNPHPQYVQKNYLTTALPGTVNQWTKIMDTTFNATHPENMMFNILLNIASTNGSTNGLLTLQGTHEANNPTGLQYYRLSYLDFMVGVKKDYLNMFALYRRTNADSTYTYELWVSSFLSSTQLIITPIVNTCFPQLWVDFTDSIDYKVISNAEMYYSNQPFVAEGSIGATLITKNVIQNDILNFNTQSDIGDMTKYYGKIVNVGGVNYNIKNSTTLTPLDITPKALSVAAADTSTTIDVASNIKSITLNQTSAVSITDFTNAYDGQVIVLYAMTANITIIHNNSKIKLTGSVNATIPQYGYLILTKFGSLWLETKRSW